MVAVVLKPVLVPVESIHPNEWNPNQQTEETFNQLVEEIRADGFDHPLNVVPFSAHPDSTEDSPQFKIIGGEHRWRAAKVVGLKRVPVVIHDDWDETQQKLKTVRRNLLSGEMDAKKFTALVASLSDDVDPQLLPGLFGFINPNEFARFIITEKSEKEDTFLDGLVEDERKREKFATDSISDVIATIFVDCAETMDQNFLCFTYKGAVVNVVMCDEECNAAVKRLTKHLKKTGDDVAQFVADAINCRLDSES
jgi:hypothetical protein